MDSVVSLLFSRTQPTSRSLRRIVYPSTVLLYSSPRCRSSRASFSQLQGLGRAMKTSHIASSVVCSQIDTVYGEILVAVRRTRAERHVAYTTQPRRREGGRYRKNHNGFAHLTRLTYSSHIPEVPRKR